MKSFECYFPLVYGEEHAKLEIEKVQTTMANLVKEYESRDKGKHKEKSSSSGSSMFLLPNRPSLKRSRYEAFLASQDITAEKVKTELDFYLEESITPDSDDFDVLNW